MTHEPLQKHDDNVTVSWCIFFVLRTDCVDPRCGNDTCLFWRSFFRSHGWLLLTYVYRSWWLCMLLTLLISGLVQHWTWSGNECERMSTCRTAVLQKGVAIICNQDSHLYLGHMHSNIPSKEYVMDHRLGMACALHRAFALTRALIFHSHKFYAQWFRTQSCVCPF